MACPPGMYCYMIEAELVSSKLNIWTLLINWRYVGESVACCDRLLDTPIMTELVVLMPWVLLAFLIFLVRMLALLSEPRGERPILVENPFFKFFVVMASNSGYDICEMFS